MINVSNESLARIKRLNKRQPLKENTDVQAVTDVAGKNAIVDHEKNVKNYDDLLSSGTNDAKRFIKDYSSDDSRYRTFNVVDRKDLANLLSKCKQQGLTFKVSRNSDPRFRYVVDVLNEGFNGNSKKLSDPMDKALYQACRLISGKNAGIVIYGYNYKNNGFVPLNPPIIKKSYRDAMEFADSFRKSLKSQAVTNIYIADRSKYSTYVYYFDNLGISLPKLNENYECDLKEATREDSRNKNHTVLDMILREIDRIPISEDFENSDDSSSELTDVTYDKKYSNWTKGRFDRQARKLGVSPFDEKYGNKKNPCHINYNAGNPDIATNAFNHATDIGSSALSENTKGGKTVLDMILNDIDSVGGDTSIKKRTSSSLREELKIYTTTLDGFTPSVNGKEEWDKIVDSKKVKDFEDALQGLYPNGISDIELDDLLSKQSDWVDKLLDLSDDTPIDNDEDVSEADKDDVEPVTADDTARGEADNDDVEPVYPDNNGNYDVDDSDDEEEKEDTSKDKDEDVEPIDTDKDDSLEPIESSDDDQQKSSTKKEGLDKTIVPEDDDASTNATTADPKYKIEVKKNGQWIPYGDSDKGEQDSRLPSLKQKYEDVRVSLNESLDEDSDDEQTAALGRGFLNRIQKPTNSISEEDTPSDVKEKAIKECATDDDDTDVVPLSEDDVNDMLGIKKEAK